MKVAITQVAPHPQGLRLGLRVEHEKAGWIRFETTVLLVDQLSIFERQSLLSALDGASGRLVEDLDIPLF